jgi:hypothetical protein
MLRKIILTTAAAALVVAPVAAQAAPERVSSPVAETEHASEGLIFALGTAAFALLVLLLADSSDEPTSP